MVDLDVVTAKLGELARRIERIREHCPAEARTLPLDEDTLDLVSFNLLLAIQACLDVASHLIADEGWPPTATLAESFHRLAEHGVLTTETADTLGAAAGMRNVLAHVYASVDPEKVHHAATAGLAELERFAAEVGGWLQERLS